MLVKEIMTKNVITIDSNDSVLEACKKYSANKVGSLVVMDRNIIVGIITERDIIENMILVNGDPKNTKVREIMSQKIKTIHATATIEKAAEIMKEYNIKKLPVVLNNEIVGIVTETDITRTIYASAMAIDELTELYYNSKEALEKMIDDWGNVIVSLKNFKQLAEVKKEKDLEL
jgi:CBS domain-containing protein